MPLVARLVSAVLLGIAGLPAVAQERVQDFANPTIRDFRLDFCRNFGTNCGQPAADLFCRELGFERATLFVPSGPVGVTTLVFGDGRFCTGPTCTGFTLIRCSAGAAAAVPGIAVPAVPPPPVQVPVPPAQAEPAAPPPVQLPVPPAQAEPAAPPPAAIEQPAIAIPLPRPRPEPVPGPEPPALVAFPGANPVFRVPGFDPALVVLGRIGMLRATGTFPGGAALFICGSGDCSVSYAVDREIDPGGDDPLADFNWSVSRVPYAGGALIQAATEAFPAFANGAATDLNPPGLIHSAYAMGQQGFFELDGRALALALPPGADGGIIHVRILPIAGTGFGAIIGLPSNVMRLYLGVAMPEPPPVQIFAPQIVAEAPPVRLVAIEFRPHRTIDWPSGCLPFDEFVRRQEESFLEAIGGAFADIWNFAAESYQWAKDAVIDIASALTFGAIPEEILAFALDAALASAGIPPDIPNLDEMLEGGLDHIAGEMAKVAVSRIPAADLAVTLGNVAADVTVNVAMAMTEAELRDRLEREVERQSREALVAAADAIETAGRAAGDVPCSQRFVPASYRVTVENTGAAPLDGIRVQVGDTEQVYFGVAETVDLDPFETLAFMAVPEPNVRDVWDRRLMRLEPMATSQNVSNWWTEWVYRRETMIVVSLPGHRECLGGCIDTTRRVFTGPPQLLTAPFVWP